MTEQKQTTEASIPEQPAPLGSLIVRGMQSMVRHGPFHFMRWARLRIIERYFERSLRISTRQGHAWNATAYQEGGEVVRYEPLPYTLITKLLKSVTKRDVRNEVFIDYGCGMGRVVLMAARQPFKRVIGIELFPELVDVAKRNAASAKPRLKSPVELVHADATQFVVPDDVSVVYLFNPFRGSVMAQMQERLRESLVRRPRPLTLLYAHASDQEDLFARCHFLKPAGHLSDSTMSQMHIRIYEAPLS
jgi:SAM-dependent methyltransferase